MKTYALLFTLTLMGCTAASTYYSTSPDTPQSCLDRGKTINSVALADGMHMSIYATQLQNKDGIGFNFIISLQNGQTFQLETNDWTLQLDNPPRRLQAAAEPYSIGIYGTKGKPGYKEYVPATDVLTGKEKMLRLGKKLILTTTPT